MKDYCERSERVAPEDVDHLESCSGCRDALIVDSFLREARPVETRKGLPASVIWIQGQIARKKRLVEEMKQREEKTRSWIMIALVSSWAIFCAIAWKPMIGWLSGVELSGLSPVTTGPVPPLTLMLAMVTLVLITMAMVTRGLAFD